MKEHLKKYIDSVADLLSNAHLDLRLEGWPAAAAIGSVCGAVVAVASIFSKAHWQEKG